MLKLQCCCWLSIPSHRSIKPVTVLILYLTAGRIEDDVRFLNDVYDRDSQVLQALDGDFTLVAPSGMPISWPMDG